MENYEFKNFKIFALKIAAVIKLEDFDLDHILIGEKSDKIILINDM